MENIQNEYRNIIERAVLAGIISEDNKHIYLSDIREENDSELSEIDARLNMENDQAYNHQFKQQSNCVDALTEQMKNADSDKQTEDTPFNSGGSPSILSGSTIENYSILDIKNLKSENDTTDDSTFDTFSATKQNGIQESTQKLKSTSVLAKTVKKPIKHQIIDFNVPIYIDINKKKSLIKPFTFNTVNNIQYGISKTCKMKNNNYESTDNEELRSISKLTLPKTKISVLKKQNTSPTITKNVVDDCSSTVNKSQAKTEHVAGKCQMQDQFTEGKLQLLSSQKKILEHQKNNPPSISKYLQIESDKTIRDSDTNRTYTMNSRRKLKVRKDLVKAEQKYETKNPANSIVHQQLNSKKKNKTKKEIYMAGETDKCERGKSHCNCKSNDSEDVNEMKAAESVSEDMISFQGISMKTDTGGNDRGRFFNVNIICQFYDDDEGDMKNGSIHISPVKNSASEAQIEKAKTPKGHISETEKTKKNKIQRLSKLWAGMKIKKKTNQ